MADETGVEYVLQVQETDGDAEAAHRLVWVDVATVTVPPRTKRRNALKAGLAQAGLDPTGATAPLRVRLLAPESAEVVPLEPDPQPARWKVAGS